MPETTPSSSDFDDQSLFEHTRWMRGLAKRLVAGGDQADDLVQSAWAIAITNPPRVGVPLRGWLAGIMRRLALLDRRAHGHRTGREQVVAADAAREAVPGTDALVALAEEKRFIIDSVLALPDHEREVILLRYYEGVPPREIARRMDIPVRAVHTLRDRALETLRVRLDTKHDGDRRAWGLALLPLARETTAAQAALTSGVAMGAFNAVALKVLAAFMVVIILALGVFALMAKGGVEPLLGRVELSSESVAGSPGDSIQARLAAPGSTADYAKSGLVVPGELAARQPAALAEGRPSSEGTVHLLVMVTDAESGAPLGDGYLHLERGSEQVAGVIEADGTFRIDFTDPDLSGPDALCRIEVEHRGYVTTRLITAVHEPVHIELVRGGTLTGTVFDDGGIPTPLAGLCLRSEVARDSSGDLLDDGSDYYDRFEPASDGTFCIAGLMPGVYVLSLLGDPDDDEEQALVKLAVTLGVGEHKVVDVLLRDPDAVTVSGLVTAPGAGRVALIPVFYPHADAGTMVTGRPLAGVGTLPGEFRAEGLQRGAYLVLLRPESVEDDGPYALLPDVKIDRSSPSERTMNFVFPPYQITGTLSRDAGLEALIVVAVPLGASGLAMSFTEGDERLELLGQSVEDDGSFALPGIATGPYRVEVFGASRSQPLGSQIVDVRGNEVLPRWNLQ